MRRILSFLDEKTGRELVLPVTPASYEWEHANRVESIQLDQIGEINLPGGKLMGRCTLSDVLFPARLYSFCNPGASATPYVYLEQLERWCDAGAPVRWMVSGTPTNARVLIESVQYSERDGTNDVYANIVLRQYQVPETPVLAAAGGGAQTARDAGTGAAQQRTYTVERGDTLWGISQKFYGDGSLYTRVASANGTAIKNPNLIYPGQVLEIPPLDQLPGAMAASTSQKIAKATTAAYDPVTNTWTMLLTPEQAAQYR